MSVPTRARQIPRTKQALSCGESTDTRAKSAPRANRYKQIPLLPAPVVKDAPLLQAHLLPVPFPEAYPCGHGRKAAPYSPPPLETPQRAPPDAGMRIKSLLWSLPPLQSSPRPLQKPVTVSYKRTRTFVCIFILPRNLARRMPVCQKNGRIYQIFCTVAKRDMSIHKPTEKGEDFRKKVFKKNATRN